MDLIANLTEAENCTQAAIDDFPNDLFTQEQRQNGAVALHVIASLYLFAALAVVCDKYFVPAVDKMCKVLNMSNDVAGATFMAAATSAPELFVNVIGTFITEGDIGVGTIVGSAVFNILAVAACCGIGAGMVVPLDWWPLTRDCVAYGTTVAILICIIHDERVEWYEALILVLLYLVYIAVMYFDKKIQKWARALLELTSVISHRTTDATMNTQDIEAIEVRWPLQGEIRPGEHQQFNGTVKWPIVTELQGLQFKKDASKNTVYHGEIIPTDGDQRKDNEKYEKDIIKDDVTTNQPPNNAKDKTEDDGNTNRANKNALEVQELDIVKAPEKNNEIKKIDEIKMDNAEEVVEDDNEYHHSLWEWPSGRGWFIQTRWIITWPIYLIFICSIPDCEKPRFRSWYTVTFLMCIIWIGSLSYVVAWMITILGHTLKIPDSVMGITFLAAGTSVPEAVSSVIVAKKGHGSMGISNSIGSNTFDILLCLGLPWLIKAAFIPTDPDHHWVAINSSGLEYSAISLLSTLFMLYVAFYFNKFRLDKKVGRACLCMYVVFLVLATLIELNVFFRVNLPTCGR